MSCKIEKFERIKILIQNSYLFPVLIFVPEDGTTLLEGAIEAALDVGFRKRALVLVFFETTFWDLFAFDFAMFVELFQKY